MKSIEWKLSDKYNESFSGIVDGEELFFLHTPYLIDKRNDIEKNYIVKTIDEGKDVSYDLLNDLNIEIHEEKHEQYLLSIENFNKMLLELEKLSNGLN